jgi:hypothetical protein
MLTLSATYDEVLSSDSVSIFPPHGIKRSHSPGRGSPELGQSLDDTKRPKASHDLTISNARPLLAFLPANVSEQVNQADAASLVQSGEADPPEVVTGITNGGDQRSAVEINEATNHTHISLEGRRPKSRSQILKQHKTEICRKYGTKLRDQLVHSKYCPLEDRAEVVGILRGVMESEATWKTPDDVQVAFRLGLGPLRDWHTRSDLLTELNQFQTASRFWWAKCMKDESLDSQKERLDVMKKAVKEVKDGVFTEAGYLGYLEYGVQTQIVSMEAGRKSHEGQVGT